MFIIGISPDGILLSHHHKLDGVGTNVGISFTWQGEAVRLVGELRWSQVQRLGSAAFGRSIYQSGFATVAYDGRSTAVLERIFTPREFVGHEYEGGEWRETRTRSSTTGQRVQDRRRPYPRGSDMLRDAYAIADSETRAIIRKMAEAVNAAGGVPQRANQWRIF